MNISEVRKMIQIIICTLVLIHTAEAAQLSRQGGYDLVIAIDENTPSPSDPEQYRKNIQTAVESLGRELATSTRFRFFINSIDIVIPSSWPISAEIATFQEYQTADVQVSEDFEAPRVENPNICGVAGQRIELPYEFFNKSRIVPNYGDAGKALLNLFARYRFGVWEEHGEFGDTRFPYFHLESSLDPFWDVTGCSADLQGSLRNLYGTSRDQCNDRNPLGPGEKCRFVPSSTNTVNSSLTFLPWANGVTEFCNEHTHNHEAPNRQNLFCGHRSVWEVIRESEDFWISTAEPSDSIKIPKFRILKVSTRPLFYLLLDTGRTATPVNVLREVTASLQALMNATFLNVDTVAAVGIFPQLNTGRDHSYVKEVAQWARIGSGDDFAGPIEAAIGQMDGPVERDFGEAIKEVVEKIKARNHPAGAVILVVKRGATSNGFSHLTYFGDVLSSIREQENIRLFGIEYQQAEKTPYVNLEPLISQVNGSLFVLNETANVQEKLRPILEEVKTALEQRSSEENSGWTIYKGFVPLNDSIFIPILDDNLQSVTICLTTTKHILDGDIEIRQVVGNLTPPPERSSRNEWNEAADLSKRTVTIVRIPNPPKDSVWEVKVNRCGSDRTEDCIAFLVANAKVQHTPNSAVEISSRDLNVEVLTSAEKNYLDLDRQGVKAVPFTIFAKVEIDGQRVLSLESVSASVILTNRFSRQTWSIPLLDDGSYLPDVSANDGIYSGIFTPPLDGLYKIYVTVTHHRLTNEVSQESVNVTSLGRLISEDQSRFGCRGSTNRRCIAAPVSDSLARTFDLIGTVYVAHSITFLPKPTKIIDFKASLAPQFKVRFSFTSPKILGSDDQPDDFFIYMSSKIRDFVGGTDEAERTLQVPGAPPGQVVEIEHTGEEGATHFYAVEAVYRDQKGGPSNVIGVVFTADGNPITPKPTVAPSTSTTLESVSTTSTRDPTSPTSTSTTTRSTTGNPVGSAGSVRNADWHVLLLVVASLLYCVRA